MQPKPKTGKLITLAAATLFLTSSFLHAQGAVSLTCVGYKEVTTVGEDGNQTVKRIPAAKVLPGEEVIYTITYEHTGKNEPAETVVITNPTPDDTVYIDGSAKGEGTEITFSVDNGKTYAKPDDLTVTAEDGTKRPARASDYTHVRWTKLEDLKKGEKGTVEFGVKVK